MKEKKEGGSLALEASVILSEQKVLGVTVHSNLISQEACQHREKFYKPEASGM